MIPFESVEAAVDEMYRSALRDINRADVSKNEAVFDAIDRLLPKSHVSHEIASLAFRCSECSHVGFIRDTVLNISTGDICCPHCHADGTLHFIEGSAA